MRRAVLSLLAATSLVSTATPAVADPPIVDGVLCGFATVIDLSAEEGTQSGVLWGGPVLLTERNGITPETGTLLCRVQVVDSFTSNHDGAGPYVDDDGPRGVFLAGPQIITIQRTGTQNVFLCAEFVDSGIPYYWDSASQNWSTSSNVPCDLSITGDGGDGPRDIEVLIDSIVCPLVALLLPPEGDIPGIWDCPPYGNRRGGSPLIGPGFASAAIVWKVE